MTLHCFDPLSLYWFSPLVLVFALFILPNAPCCSFLLKWDTTGKEKPALCLCSVSARLHISNSLRNLCFWLNCQVAENNFQDPTQSKQTLHAAKPLRHSLFFFLFVYTQDFCHYNVWEIHIHQYLYLSGIWLVPGLPLTANKTFILI